MFLSVNLNYCFLIKICILITILFSSCKNDKKERGENVTFSPTWSVQKANQWYKMNKWPVGCNYIPSTAVNQLEMWQATTFDTITINKELGWAKNLGFNSLRVFLHYLLWQEDKEGFYSRIEKFLQIAHQNGMSVMFVLFDDCGNGNPVLGTQEPPIAGIHNSGWVQCPGHAQVRDSTLFPVYSDYVKGIIKKFREDKRVLCWDLYNEAGNSYHFEETLPLLKKIFQWAREAQPSQPITSGLWQSGALEYRNMNYFILDNSDIITFHSYGSYENMLKEIKKLKSYGRPVICTEYMARTLNSLFTTHLPLLKKENVGAYNWGLVAGKSQTIFPWGSSLNAPEPKIWFHDIFYKDGRPYDEKEVALIKSVTGLGK